MTRNFAIIGGGLIGLSLAYKLLLIDKSNRVIIYEKEGKLGLHQSSRNSGVIHCGLLYATGSLKAKFSYDGSRQLKSFCKEHLIDIDNCGKIVVNNSLKVLEDIAKRGEINGLGNLKILSKSEIRKLEPNLKKDFGLLVPDESIVDYKQVILKLKELILDRGGEIKYNFNIHGEDKISDNLIEDKKFSYLINTSGLYSDKVFQILTGTKLSSQIIPFRGEYYNLKERYNDLFSNLIYEAPNSDFPFLGVHFTKHINGFKSVGPNAVLAFKKEGYSFLDFDFREFMESISHRGLQRFIINNPKFCIKEFYLSLNRNAFLQQTKSYFPEIQTSMFEKKMFSGVRAQSIDIRGNLLLDFDIKKHKNQIHVLNAPSPGASSSLAFADILIKNYL